MPPGIPGTESLHHVFWSSTNETQKISSLGNTEYATRACERPPPLPCYPISNPPPLPARVPLPLCTNENSLIRTTGLVFLSASDWLVPELWLSSEVGFPGLSPPGSGTSHWSPRSLWLCLTRGRVSTGFIMRRAGLRTLTAEGLFSWGCILMSSRVFLHMFFHARPHSCTSFTCHMLFLWIQRCLDHDRVHLSRWRFWVAFF